MSASIRGRGAISNPTNRFEKISLERDVDWNPEEDSPPRTSFYRDHSRTIITYNDSPDIPFNASLNPYRGCEHGCSYCYARPTHEYLGFSAGLDFETKIMVKEDAPELLRQELSSPEWKPQVLAMSGVTDCYQPIERRLGLTRRCLAVLAEFRNPVSIITKNFLVTRDIDLLKELATHRAVTVHLSISSLDPDLARKLEPRAASPRQRLAAVEALAKAGVPVGVLVAPVIPALNEPEMASVLAAAKDAGAGWAGTEVLRLPLTVAPVFEAWLGRHLPERKEKILNRIRSIRGGRLNDPRFGSRMRGEGVFADQIAQLFRVARRRAGLAEHGPELSVAAFRRPGGSQLDLGI
ncbi:MAG TPA: PA0069 family radical SAM protein [Verrucomicrobiota bacterium]|nr:PA0069 family radical SAM protein [Verrucomicrobiota bacterium]HOP97987.1 PA0069 family radical SAM protein [Verrucomicrobiota bacterium]